MKRAPDQKRQGHEAKQEDGNFGPFAGEECTHASIPASVVFLQVHAGVEAGDLIAVAVEHQRLALERFRRGGVPWPGSSADDPRWDSRWNRSRIRWESARFQVVGGIF